jgi:hypothetical protein
VNQSDLTSRKGYCRFKGGKKAACDCAENTAPSAACHNLGDKQE